MTIYVESNFVLEIALGQEQANAALAILERAEGDEVALALPAFSLSEPFSTITQRARSQQRASRQLTDHVRELARSGPHREDVQFLESIPARLEIIEKRELQRLTETIGRILAASTVIPVTAQVYDAAMSFKDRLGLMPQDAIILAAILSHLEASIVPGQHLFISKNWKDFDHPHVHAELAALNCEYITNFLEGALRLGIEPPEGFREE